MAPRGRRSALTVGLVAFASFILVTIASMRENMAEERGERPSGTGGYALVMTADIPVLGDLNTVAGRKLAGIRNPEAAIWSRAKFTNLRVWHGQDISCLNMMRPTAPRIVGVPEGEIDQRFVTSAGRAERTGDDSDIRGPVRREASGSGSGRGGRRYGAIHSASGGSRYN